MNDQILLAIIKLQQDIAKQQTILLEQLEQAHQFELKHIKQMVIEDVPHQYQSRLLTHLQEV